MATPEEIIDVREKTNELTTDPWSDEDIATLVDSLGNADLAAAHIWDKKASKYAELVNTSEAGASRAFSDLYDRAIARSEFYEAAGATVDPTVHTTRVHKIVRT